MPPIVKTENKYGLDWVLLNGRWYSVQNYSPTKLADGSPIPIVTNGTTWAGLTTPARCTYNNSVDAAYIAKYGYLYNWYAVDAGLEMPCADCVVPSQQGWVDLQNWMVANGFNWDETLEGNKLGKSLASDGGEWDASATEGHPGNDQSSNNSSGFSLLPGGFRFSSSGEFLVAGGTGRVWSSTQGVFFGTRSSYEISEIGTGISSQNGLNIRISRPYVPSSRRPYQTSMSYSMSMGAI